MALLAPRPSAPRGASRWIGRPALCALAGLAISGQLHLEPVEASSAAGTGERSAEYAVKVALLFKLALFIEWPASDDGDPDAFVIGVLGEDPFGPLLEEVVAGEAIGGLPVRILRGKDLEPLLASRILFISRSESQRVEEVVAGSRDHGILTVGDARGFCERGGMVNLLVDSGRVGVELNRFEADRAGLQINSKLIQLARDVPTRDRGAVGG